MEDVNTIFFKIANLRIIHKEFVYDLQAALSRPHTAGDIVIGSAFHKLVSSSVSRSDASISLCQFWYDIDTIFTKYADIQGAAK